MREIERCMRSRKRLRLFFSLGSQRSLPLTRLSPLTRTVSPISACLNNACSRSFVWRYSMCFLSRFKHFLAVPSFSSSLTLFFFSSLCSWRTVCVERLCCESRNGQLLFCAAWYTGHEQLSRRNELSGACTLCDTADSRV